MSVITSPQSARSARRRAARRRAALIGAAGVASALVATTAGIGAASASSHREAPAIAGLPRLDGTDTYAFLSPDKTGTATLIANWNPFETPAGGPNFYSFDPNAHYDINIDTNGDAKPDIIYRWDFYSQVIDGNSFLYNTGAVHRTGDPTLNMRQTYKFLKWTPGTGWVRQQEGVPVAPSRVGDASMPDYSALREQAIRNIKGNQVFAGQADDPFFLDLRVFDLLYGGNLSEVGNDTLAGYNVQTTAIQVPVSELGGAHNIVGVWSSSDKVNSDGTAVQVSRVGNPLVNEVVVPLKDKDKWNGSLPKDDLQFLDYVTKPILPKVIQAVYGIPAPAEPRNDLVSVFLTGVAGINQPAHVTPSEELRLNLTPFSGQTYNRLGVLGGDKNGFPNGRRLADDIVDESLQVVEGALVGQQTGLGDGVNQNDRPFFAHFPYVALPHSGSTVSGSPATTALHTGLTALTGGAPINTADTGSGTTAGLPIAAGLGALVLVGGAVAATRRRNSTVTA